MRLEGSKRISSILVSNNVIEVSFINDNDTDVIKTEVFDYKNSNLKTISKFYKENRITSIIIVVDTDSWRFLWYYFGAQYEIITVQKSSISQSSKTHITKSILSMFIQNRLSTRRMHYSKIFELRELTRCREDIMIKLFSLKSKIIKTHQMSMPPCNKTLTDMRNPEMIYHSLPDTFSKIKAYNIDFSLRIMIEEENYYQKIIERVMKRIDAQSFFVKVHIENMISIPGMNKRIAENLISEIGSDFNRFSTIEKFMAWVGIFRVFKCESIQNELNHVATKSVRDRIKKYCMDVVGNIEVGKHGLLTEIFYRDTRKKDIRFARTNMLYVLLNLLYYTLYNKIHYSSIPEESIRKITIPSFNNNQLNYETNMKYKRSNGKL